MSDEKDNSTKEGAGLGTRLLFIAIVFVFLYVVHLGPLIYALDFFEIRPQDDFRKIFLTFELPHLYVSYYSETYFDYLNWCSGVSTSGNDWARFRDMFDAGELY